MSQPATGRRERKKAATHRAIADAALHLFLERGFDRVSVKEIADAADVSTTTLFKHFPSKEALVFDEEADQEASLVAAVRDRAPGQSIPAALHALFLRAGGDERDPRLAAFMAMVNDTPALREYGRRMWTRHEVALAAAIAAETGAPPDDIACAALARFVLEGLLLARAQPDRLAALDRIFALIEHGWSAARESAVGTRQSAEG